MTEFPKIIIGTSGQVARALREKFIENKEEFISTSRKSMQSSFFLDLSNPKSITGFFSEFSTKYPGVKADIFLPGAMTHVDKCEQEKKICYEVNSEGPR